MPRHCGWWRLLESKDMIAKWGRLISSMEHQKTQPWKAVFFGFGELSC
jgi:hypothetical protein